ncbi:MAG TPA: Cys-tRNA(Pro) deacylase [Lachnospiraceae bacterium]|jgi:Cys-tRNA(Pro)/Cys-tRNA(Cys) deacylase|nr:Cys-tRNA(Pro) deacylase [Lachnospiraceae bacterium]
MKKTEKTNVMRELERLKIDYTSHTYEHGKDAVDGAEVARLTGQDPARVFKTLVCISSKGQHYVFDIPVLKELDLKKCAKAVGEKSIQMIHVKDLLPLTGYIRGGCSPIGMKKKFPTVIDESCLDKETVMVSAGKIGYQVELTPQDLIQAAQAQTANITKDN